AGEKKMVWVGRMTVVVSMLLALVVTWKDSLGIGSEGGFTFIQKYTGFISPGILAMFLLGMFWKRTTGAAAIAGLITGFTLSVFFNEFAPAVLGKETFLYTAYEYTKMNNGVMETVVEIPFLICMGWSFFFTMAVMILMSLAGPKVSAKAFALDPSMFKLKPSTIVMIVITLMLLSVLYVKFW
ncbi:MAG: sodium transporter, partial [Pedobacter sp.]